MSTFEHKPNTGSLFKNDKKTEERHPDYTGMAMINGRLTRISGWKREGKKGTFLALAFQAAEDKGQRTDMRPGPSRQSEVDDDGIPF